MAAKILKLLCVFFAAAAVLLCACDKKGDAPPAAAAGFRADFTADYRGMHPSGSLTHTRQGACSVRFTAPPTLAGLEVRIKNGALSLLRGSAAATADEPYLPAESFPSLLHALLHTAGEETTANGERCLHLSLPCGEGTLTVDESALPQSAAVPGADFQICFSRCEPLG